MSVTMILGALWGDEGKGRVVHAVAEGYDVVCRFNGGPNAAHTVLIGNDLFRLHQVPCGIFNPEALCCTGDGMVINLEQLVGELEDLRAARIDVSGFRLSREAQVVLPLHLLLERRREELLGSDNVGSTRQGIGPAFADKVMRIGVRVEDLYEPPLLRRKLEYLLADKGPLLDDLPSLEEMEAELTAQAAALEPYVADTKALLHEAHARGARILVEGAQGTLLDIDHGTYPYVTATHPTSGGALAALGLPPSAAKTIYGVARTYCTRQDNGTFPTEVPVEDEQRFRAVTRDWTIRVGWLDLVALRHAVAINGFTALVLTRLDSVAALEQIKICVAYEVGPDRLTRARPNPRLDSRSRCVYEALPGWNADLAGVERYNELPEGAKRFVERIETEVSLPVAAVSASRAGPLLWR